MTSPLRRRFKQSQSILPNLTPLLLPVLALVLAAVSCQLEGEMVDKAFWLAVLSGQGILTLPLTFVVIVIGYDWVKNKYTDPASNPAESAYTKFSLGYLLVLFVFCLVMIMLLSSTEIGQQFGFKFTAAPLGFLWIASMAMALFVGRAGPHRRYLTIPLVLYVAMIISFFITA